LEGEKGTKGIKERSKEIGVKDEDMKATISLGLSTSHINPKTKGVYSFKINISCVAWKMLILCDDHEHGMYRSC
jgi:hypothetical protein